MTKIDFYVLPKTGGINVMSAVSRIAEKAMTRGHQIFIQVTNESDAAVVQGALWADRPESFLPSAILGQDDGEPILVGWQEPPLQHDDVMINITGKLQGHFSRFQRLAEIVVHEEAALAASREAWRFFRDRGYPLAKHDL